MDVVQEISSSSHPMSVMNPVSVEVVVWGEVGNAYDRPARAEEPDCETWVMPVNCLDVSPSQGPSFHLERTSAGKLTHIHTDRQTDGQAGGHVRLGARAPEHGASQKSAKRVESVKSMLRVCDVPPSYVESRSGGR